MYKGGGCERQAPKSYRPVALLSATSRIMEGILARQFDNYQEDHGLIHKGVHGFRRGRGTNTAMLEVWEYVLSKTEKGDLVALDFLDISAGFDTMVHLYLLRKLEVQFGVAEESLKWLSSYLEGWVQYTVVEASSSTPRQMTKGAPQGGGLSPILWRSDTNDIPEAGLRRREHPAGLDLQQRPMERPRKDKGILSEIVDRKTSPTIEEQLDMQLRREGIWDLASWRAERSGGNEGAADQLKTKEKEEDNDVLTTIYADDTQSRTSAKTKKELEQRNSSGLTRVCEELKKLRLKVNEDKTTYMILATQGRRARENLDSEIVVCGERVKNVKVGKALGLLVSDDLTWRDQVDKTVKSCQEKMRGLWKCTPFLKQHQRKVKAEGIIISRLSYCLEVVSSGRKVDLERLQGVQSAAARWVLQTRKRDWSLSGGLRKLGWLSIAQLAVYSSLKLAVRVLGDNKPERLYETLTDEIEGDRVRRVITDRSLKKMKATTKKSWSVRVLRWLELMPEQTRQGDMTKRRGKEDMKRWIKHTIPVRGDRVLWGQMLTGDQRRRRNGATQGPQNQGGGARDGDQMPGVRPAGSQHSQEEENEQVLALVREAGQGAVSEDTEVESNSQAVEGQREEGFWRRLGWRRYGGRRKPQGIVRRSLPSSLAAVVKTSPEGSRETGFTKTGQSGEQEGKDAGAARLLPQARLPGRGAQLAGRRAASGERMCCRRGVCWALGWTGSYLVWRRGVG